MLFKKWVSGGILIYTMLMTVVLVGILQVYNRQVDYFRSEYRAQLNYSKAQMMVIYLKKNSKTEKNQYQFNEGKVSVQKNKHYHIYNVHVNDGHQYTFYQSLNDKDKDTIE